jgi:chromosome partitioning protein
MKVITVTNLKGGSGKTTTTAFLAHALENIGRRVLVIDSDPQGSLLRWSRAASWSIPVKHLHSPQLGREIAGLDLHGFDAVIVDTPPGEGDGVAHAAMRAADVIVLPVAPTTMEIRRVRFTIDAAAKHAPGIPVHVLLNRVAANTKNAASNAREALAASGRTVLDAQIPMLQILAQAEGQAVDAGKGFHGHIAAALELAV